MFPWSLTEGLGSFGISFIALSASRYVAANCFGVYLVQRKEEPLVLCEKEGTRTGRKVAMLTLFLPFLSPSPQGGPECFIHY
jgi:hypothetical protein